MNKVMLISIIGGALIVLLTAIFAFTPNSVNPSSIPTLKSYALEVINNQRHKLHLQPLREGAAISADKQAKYLLTQLTLTHLDFLWKWSFKAIFREQRNRICCRKSFYLSL